MKQNKGGTMKRLVLAVMLFILPSLAMAYDYDTESKDQLKYNAYESKWSYEPKESTIKYNAYESEWSYEKPKSELKYNAYEGKFEYAE